MPYSLDIPIWVLATFFSFIAGFTIAWVWANHRRDVEEGDRVKTRCGF